MCLWGWSRQAIAVLGTSRTAWTALVATLCLSTLLSSVIRRVARRRLEGATAASVRSSVWLASAGFVALFAVFSEIGPTVALTGLDLLSTPLVLQSVAAQLALLTLVCSTGWLVPMTAAAFLIAGERDAGRPQRLLKARALVIAGLGVVASEFLAAFAGGMDRSLLVAALFGTHAVLAGIWICAVRQQSDRETSENEVGSVSENRAGRGVGEVQAAGSRAATAIQIGLQGALCLFLLRLLDQLLLPFSWVSAVGVAALLAGAGFGQSLYRARSRGSRFSRMLGRLQRVDSVLISVVGGLLGVALFEPLVWLTLSVNADVISVVWSTLSLAAIVAVLIGVVGVATGGLVAHGAGPLEESSHSTIQRLLLFPVGMITAAWLAPALGLSSVAILLTIAVMATVSLAEQLRARSWRVLLRPQWGLCAVAIALTAGLAGSQRGVTLAARLLYDTRVFIASQIEERNDTLPYLDEARCVAVAETDSGTLTIWKRRVCEFEMRRSGVPLGAVSLDTFVAPQRTGETLQTVLPLCLHPDAEDLLLLGAGSGSALETSVFFPLRQMTCVEPDGRHLQMLSQHLFSQMPLDPLKDERVSVVAADPEIAVRSLTQTYDLVLASATQPAFAHAAAISSREFLTAAAARLSDDGLFCQPLDIVDLGPDALGAVIGTWMSVFADVSAFEIGPGRLLLVGRQDDETDRFDGKGFLERLQRSHVRTVLAGLGWDWSTVLKVMAYSHRDLQQAFPEGRSRVNSVANVAFSARLPFEITSWGPKYQQTLARLEEVAGSLQFMTGTAGQDPNVKRRMADLKEHTDLVHDKPDHYWAYRARVKERIKSSPQSELVQVKGENPYHTLSGAEKRRLEYFETLGEAAQQQRPTASALNAVAEFDSPFDPLVSPFLHQEIAELAERDPQQLGGIELWHRVHRAFFASPADRSVRNVSRALELLSRQPELISDPAARGDCLDALLQVLHNRWHNRGDISPDSSQIVLNDIESSLAAINLAFDQLAELSVAREMPADAWPARRLAVEKSLVRPLEAYRSMLLPRHAKRQRRARSTGGQ